MQKFLSLGNILALAAFIASCQQKYDAVFDMGVINTQTGTVIDAQLPHTFADRLVISKISINHSHDATINCKACAQIA